MHVKAKVPIVGDKNIQKNGVMRREKALRAMRTRGEYCFLWEVKYYMDFTPKYLLKMCILWGSKRKTAFYRGRNAKSKNRFSLWEMTVDFRRHRTCSLELLQEPLNLFWYYSVEKPRANFFNFLNNTRCCESSHLNWATICKWYNPITALWRKHGYCWWL